MGRLTGKATVVTGAGSGIGRASSILFAAEGARLVLVDQNEASLNETLDMVRDEGGEAVAQTADVGDEDQVQGFIDTCMSTYGGIDAIYANAGVSAGATSLFDQGPDDWMQILRTNLVGPFLAVKHAAPHMVDAGGGSIVCTASVAALRANAGSTIYSASKAGVVGLVKSAANELSGTSVRINAICPGLIETGMTKPIFDMARERGSLEKIGQLNPARRYGHPAEIAQMALFLLSDEASYVNGQAIAVDGGLSSTHPFVYR